MKTDKETKHNALSSRAHEAHNFGYLAYVIPAWIFYLVYAVITAGIIDFELSYLLFTVFKGSTGIEIINFIVWLTVTIQTLRIFFGIYFSKADQSFLKGKERWLKSHDRMSQRWYISTEALLSVSHIALLGFLAFSIKSASIWITIGILLVQSALIQFYNFKFKDLLKSDADQKSIAYIRFTDFLFLLFTCLLAYYALVMHGYISLTFDPEYHKIFIYGFSALFAFLFYLEISFSYGQSLKDTLGATICCAVVAFPCFRSAANYRRFLRDSHQRNRGLEE